MPSAAEFRRARPLLGTLVEIAVPDDPGAATAVDRAFAAIARVHRLMSAHDDSSDIGRLASERPGRWVAIDSSTWRVLSRAREFAIQSAGVFDPVSVATAGRATWIDLELGEDRISARCARRLRIDLGGIAKGFAVDQAVRALRRTGCGWSLVNAGGDLRAFGPRQWAVHSRHPAQPGLLISMDPLSNGAMATSAPYFSERIEHGRIVSALSDPVRNRFEHGPVSVTVRARTALAADALTKIVLFCEPSTATAILRRHRASAVVHRPREEVLRAG